MRCSVLEMVAVVATMSVFEISGESGIFSILVLPHMEWIVCFKHICITGTTPCGLGEGAVCREHAGGSAHDTHSLVMNALDNYLLYSHISTIWHRTDVGLGSWQVEDWQMPDLHVSDFCILTWISVGWCEEFRAALHVWKQLIYLE